MLQITQRKDRKGTHANINLTLSEVVSGFSSYPINKHFVLNKKTTSWQSVHVFIRRRSELRGKQLIYLYVLTFDSHNKLMRNVPDLIHRVGFIVVVLLKKRIGQNKRKLQLYIHHEKKKKAMKRIKRAIKSLTIKSNTLNPIFSNTRHMWP